MRITRLLPNPAGDETRNETATLKNLGPAAADLTGWKLRDLAGKTWKLDSLGTLAAGEEKTIRRDGQEMSLNNGGDTIDLVDPAGAVVQTVTYPSFVDDEGEEFEVAAPAPGPAPGPAPVVLKLGALNVEWLGTPDRRASPAKSMAQKAIARMVAQVTPRKATSPRMLFSANRVVSKLKISKAISATTRIMPTTVLRDAFLNGRSTD